MKYRVFFDIFGKKLKTVVDADNIDEAKAIVVSKIIFHKVILCDDDDIDNEENFNPSSNFDLENIKNLLGIK